MKSPQTTNQTMDHLTDRVRAILGDDPRVTEKNMFGGLTFLLDGHILVGCKKDGRVLLSVGKEHNAEALARPGASQMIHNGRTMTGFVWVKPDAIEDDPDLEDWVALARRWVSQMPAKPAPAAKKAAPAKRPATKAAAAKTAAPRGKRPAR